MNNKEENSPKLIGSYRGGANIYAFLNNLPKWPGLLLGAIIKCISLSEKNFEKKHFKIMKYYLYEFFELNEYETTEKELRELYKRAAEELKGIEFNLEVNYGEEIIKDNMLLKHHWNPSKDYFEISMNPRFVCRLIELLDSTFEGIKFKISEK